MPSSTRRQMSPRASAAGRGVQPLRRHARLLQGRDLVGHQRDQRRDDEAEAAAAPATGSGSTGSCRRRSAAPPARCARPALRRSRRPAGRGTRRGRTCGAGCRARRRGMPPPAIDPGKLRNQQPRRLMGQPCQACKQLKQLERRVPQDCMDPLGPAADRRRDCASPLR